MEMEHEQEIREECPVSEMAIVNTFTKLIFGQEQDYSPRELSIVQAFRLVEANVLRDSHLEMGEYLRNLGVREMIQLVSRLRDYMSENVESFSSIHRQTARAANVNQPR
jgi:hypothetical protein